ncbi:MAG: ABC transporter permease [Betaproteobacteria bacterium]|nr:ABC transporter permease [Betaproteobacteria bacterium]
MKYFTPPQLSLRFLPIWQRHFLVWKKLAIPNMLGNLADPIFYMLGFGYGIGSLMPHIGGVSYLSFLSAGSLCYSTMNSASFETLYSGFSRMHVQKTWEAIMNTPLTLDDILLSELFWGATKSLLSGVAILIVIWGLGLEHDWALSLWAIPVAFLIGLTFSAMGLVMNAISPGYEFFMYYFTLVITPMVLLGGVFFPTERMPATFQFVAACLPLTHALQLVRPLIMGHIPHDMGRHILIMLVWGASSFWLATGLTRRRLLH